MIRMQPSVRIIVVENSDPVRAYFHISHVTFAVAEDKVRRRTRAITARQSHDVGDGSLLQHHALQRIMRQARLPLEVVQGVCEVRDAELVHA